MSNLEHTIVILRQPQPLLRSRRITRNLGEGISGWGREGKKEKREQDKAAHDR